MILMNYIVAFFLICLGFYTVVTKYNLIKTVIGLSIADYGVNLLIISVGFNPGGTAPIFTWTELNPSSFFVDPIPHKAIFYACRAGSRAAKHNVSQAIAERIAALPEAPLDEELDALLHNASQSATQNSVETDAEKR